MNKTDIERILRLQKGAYELLLWIDKRAAQEPELLSDDNLEKWRFAHSCEVWVRVIYGMIPQDIRPAVEDIADFARLYSSFFQTSFQVVETTPALVYDRLERKMYAADKRTRKLVAGAPAGKKSAKGKERVRDSARELRLHALEELALEHELFPTREQLEKVLSQPAMRDALTLWTYVLELKRRADFVSQGEAVRSLWLSMSKSERSIIRPVDVINARNILLGAVRLATPA